MVLSDITNAREMPARACFPACRVDVCKASLHLQPEAIPLWGALFTDMISMVVFS